MSFYDNGSDFPWKQQEDPSSPDAEAEVAEFASKAADDNVVMHSVNDSASSPAFNFGDVANNSGYTNTEIVVTDNNFHGDFVSNTAGGGNYYFSNDLNNNANAIINPNILNDSPDQEESQVVPDSLDHLSRDELCRMIYRLDYERNTLQDKLQALRNQVSNLKIVAAEESRRKKKGKKRPRGGSISSSADMAHMQQQHLAHNLQKLPLAKGGEDVNDNNVIILDTPPTPAEIECVQKGLRESMINAIKSTAIHGGRKIPKTTICKTNLAEPIISAIMQNYNDQKISETKRMIKWAFTNDKDIVTLLKTEERLVHPVKHDGTGYIMPSGSHPSNMYHWAQFAGMEVKYDRRERILTLVARTVEAGKSGRPERLVEKARYSSGETDDFPG